ncbi:MAG: SulP family inorganic anion transporter, partial [Gammaproteobacteria bacterium]|nr:SulP family inorganic anion transporter [Gammaproteobacteria bacterium]
ALPMGLAFGVVSGLGPVAGLYSAVCTGIFAALFGGTATQIAGPTGPIAIVMASVVVGFAAEPLAVAGVVLLAGAIQIAFGALRLGRYISLVPYPVMSGFGTAVGCIIIVMQINPLLGQPPVRDTLTAVMVLPEQLGGINPAAVAVALACAFACVLAPRRIRSVVPIHLAVIVSGSIIVNLLGLDVPYLATPASLLPEFQWPPLLQLPWSEMWVAALVLALISSLDSLLTSVAADHATQQLHDSDRELVGQGLGNLCAGLIGALPGSGSTFRTLANIRSGGRTPLSAVSHSVVLLALLLGAGNLIHLIPASVLAGILIYIGFGIIDWKYIRRFPYVPRGGVLIMVTVWLVALFGNVVTGAAIGFVMASLGFVKRMADLQLAAVDVSDAAGEGSQLNADERRALEKSNHGTLLINLAGPVTFGAANRLYRRLANIAAYRAIVLDFTDVPHIDESGLIALENIIRSAGANNQKVLVAGLRRDIARAIIEFGLSPLLKSCPRHERRLDALEAASRISVEEKDAV